MELSPSEIEQLIRRVAREVSLPGDASGADLSEIDKRLTAIENELRAHRDLTDGRLQRVTEQLAAVRANEAHTNEMGTTKSEYPEDPKLDEWKAKWRESDRRFYRGLWLVGGQYLLLIILLTAFEFWV
jgi:glutathione S-transferase